MLKLARIAVALVASSLGVAVVACSAPPPSDSSQSLTTAITLGSTVGINRCAVDVWCSASGSTYGHTECPTAGQLDAGIYFRGACPAIDQSCDPYGAPCSLDDLPKGATSASCVQAAAFPGQEGPWSCLAD